METNKFSLFNKFIYRLEIENLCGELAKYLWPAETSHNRAWCGLFNAQ